MLIWGTAAHGCALCCTSRLAAQCCMPHAEAAFAGDARRTCAPVLAPLSHAKACVNRVRACGRAC
eukprot:4608915-Alexandrium_andersonii.AAC.1